MKYALKKINPIYFLLLLNIIVGFCYILKTPAFQGDDYFIFALVKDILYGHFSINISSHYSPFLRPIYLLFLIFDYKILFCNPYLIKTFNLTIHLFIVLLLYDFYRKFFDLLKIISSKFFITIILLIFSVNVISFFWIEWISNQNELVMFLFYLLSLTAFIRYFLKGRITCMYLFLFFFVISFLSKQTALNIPYITLFFCIFYKSRIEKRLIKKAKLFSVIGIIISLMYFCISLLTIKNDIIFEYFYKKPFSLIGGLILIVFQSLGSEIYYYFLGHPDLSLILFLILISLLIFFIKRFRLNIHLNFFVLFFFLILIFIPRIFGVIEIRSLSIQYFWVLLLLSLYYSKTAKYKRYIIIIFILHFCFSVHNIYINYNSTINYNSFVNKINNDLRYKYPNSDNILVLCHL